MRAHSHRTRRFGCLRVRSLGGALGLWARAIFIPEWASASLGCPRSAGVFPNKAAMSRAAATFFAVPREERGGDKARRHRRAYAHAQPCGQSRPALKGAAGGTGPMTMAAAISNTIPLIFAARSNRRKHQVGDVACEVS